MKLYSVLMMNPIWSSFVRKKLSFHNIALQFILQPIVPVAAN